MIDFRDLQRLATSLLAPVTVSEVEVRQSISAAYYGLFHRLTAAGSEYFAAGGAVLPRQVARAFSHAAMRKVCDAYTRKPAQPFPPDLALLNAAAFDPRVAVIADAFSRLQEARHTADYDVSAMVLLSFGRDMLVLAEGAHVLLDQIAALPQTTVFLAALLLADRWTRRG